MFGQDGTFSLGRWLGVPFYFHWTAFLMVFLAAQATGSSGAAAFLMVLIHLFLGIGLHELGHALIARANGAQGITITFWAIGGVCSSHRESRPWSDLAIVIAGPLVSFILATFYFLTALVLFRLDLNLGFQVQSALNQFVSIGFILNLILGIFNCFPIYPLDGGQGVFNILRIFKLREHTVRSATIFVSVLGVLAYLWINGWRHSPEGTRLTNFAEVVKHNDVFDFLFAGFLFFWGYSILRIR